MPLKQLVSGLEQSQPGGGGAGGGDGGCGGEGGGCAGGCAGGCGGGCGGIAGGSPHASDDQMNSSSCRQPAPQPIEDVLLQVFDKNHNKKVSEEEVSKALDMFVEMSSN